MDKIIQSWHSWEKYVLISINGWDVETEYEQWQQVTVRAVLKLRVWHVRSGVRGQGSK